MKGWQEHQIQALRSSRDEHELLEALIAIARELEFDHCAYGIRAPYPFTKSRVVMLNNYPEEWQTCYREKNYLATDPTVHHAACSPLPIIWSDELFASAPDLWEDAKSHGLRVGWAQSSRDTNGFLGLLTLARSAEPISEDELRDKRLKMAWLTQVAHLSMSRCLNAKLVPESEVQLTNREVAVLRWTAEGKTSREVAEIIGITERTVNFHIHHAVTKLNAANKTAAVVMAAALGLLY